MFHNIKIKYTFLIGIKYRVQGSKYNNIQEVIENLSYIRENVEKEADVIYQQATRMAGKLFVEPTIPRTATRQAHRNNVPAETPLVYYKRALIRPFMDTIISETKSRFQKMHCIAGKVLCLIPSIICNEETTDLKELYTRCFFIRNTLFGFSLDVSYLFAKLSLKCF